MTRKIAGVVEEFKHTVATPETLEVRLSEYGDNWLSVLVPSSLKGIHAHATLNGKFVNLSQLLAGLGAIPNTNGNTVIRVTIQKDPHTYGFFHGAVFLTKE